MLRWDCTEWPTNGIWIRYHQLYVHFWITELTPTNFNYMFINIRSIGLSREIQTNGVFFTLFPKKKIEIDQDVDLMLIECLMFQT